MLTPLTGRVLIKPYEPPDITESGLHLVQHWKPENTGEVVAVAARSDACCPECGTRIFGRPIVEVGQDVLFSANAGLEVRINGERFLILRETDIESVLTLETV